MNRVLSFFKARISLLVFLCLFIILSSVALFSYTPIRLYPEANKARINLNVRYDGISEAEFRFKYGRTIENSLVSLEARDKVEADYSSFRTTYTISFDWSLDLEEAKKRVKEYSNSLASFLPKSYRVWVRTAERGGSNLFAGIISKEENKKDLTQLLKNQFVPAFEALKLTNYAFAFNPLSENFIIDIHRDFLLHPLFSLKKIESAIRSSQFSSYLGQLIRENKSSQAIYLSSPMRNFEDIGKIDVFFSDKLHLRIDQFADLKRDSKLRENEYYVSGESVLIAGAGATAGSNLKEFSSEFYRILNTTLSGFSTDTVVSKILDPADFIIEAVSKLYISVGLSVLMTGLVLFLFLGKISSVLAACICIPFFLMGGFLLLTTFRNRNQS